MLMLQFLIFQTSCVSVFFAFMNSFISISFLTERQDKVSRIGIQNTTAPLVPAGGWLSQHWKNNQSQLNEGEENDHKQNHSRGCSRLGGKPGPQLGKYSMFWLALKLGEKIWVTFSISSMQAAKSMPKSIKAHSIPSLLYSSCSSTNMWWLKNCWSFSLVKLIHSCSNPLYYTPT